MKLETKNKTKNALARPLAPEDITRGMHVAVLYDVFEYLLFDCASSLEPKPKQLRLRWTPFDTRAPLEVIDVCLPFVLTKDSEGTVTHLDTRRHRLARIHDRYGAAYAKAVEEQRKRERRVEAGKKPRKKRRRKRRGKKANP